ncbi:MAG TPA: PucR family transcriptional regulator ligand-binding domain-containing protein [Streptosporangiales bacterium]
MGGGADGRRPVPGSVSVREILDFEMLAEARVLAGAGGLDRRVQRLNVMTVPDIVRWTKDHELLLTTGYPLPDAPEELVKLLTELDARGVAAVGVKYGSYGPGIAPEALDAADGLGLPIIDIPEAVAFDDLLSHVLSQIVNRQAAALAYAKEIHEALLHIFLGGGGLDDIARELSAALDGAGVICVDPAGRVLAEVAEPRHWQRLRADRFLDEDGTVAVNRLRAASAYVTAAPVLAGTLQHGQLLAVRADEPLPAEAEVMVQQSAMVAALEITKRLAVSSAERHFESNAIHDLLAGADRDVEHALERAASFGWDLDRRLVVVVAREDAAEDGEARHHYDVDTWVTIVHRHDRGAVAGLLGRDLVAVCGVGGGPEPVARALADGMRDSTRRAFALGVSGVVDAARELPAGYRHARTALDIGRRTYGHGAVTLYERLGLYRLFNAVGDPAELRTFVDETLGAVLARPPDERADLLHTLDVLLAHRLNVAESARVLHFHYNTLRYRIRKLTGLVGPFTEDSRLCLRLGVALEVLHMWKLSEPATWPGGPTTP